jgi:hypothetical protein
MLTNSREGYAEDWGSSFDDLDAEYWESYFDGPDESEVETCYQGEGCYEDDYCEDDYYEDLYEEDIDQVEDNREIYFQSIRDEYFGHEPEIEIMTSLAYAPPMSDSEVEKYMSKEQDDQDCTTDNFFCDSVHILQNHSITENRRKDREVIPSKNRKIFQHIGGWILRFLIFCYFSVGFFEFFELKGFIFVKMIVYGTMIFSVSIFYIFLFIVLIGLIFHALHVIFKHLLSLFSIDPKPLLSKIAFKGCPPR